tara:strand:+ start:477 stop:1031 length:555 start_codon:yes stop_codon:yes gene_type:complete
MNCYDFELKITPFLEGELKQKELTTFRTHREACTGCKSKLESMKGMLNSLKDINPLTVPNDFTVKLHHKINQIENRKLAKKWNFLELLPFGMRPLHTMAFGLSLVVVVASSFLLLNGDKVPTVNMNEHNQANTMNQYKQAAPQTQNQGFYTQKTKQDTTSRDSISNPDRFSGSTPPIQLVKKNK